jgi:hypothetical protein
MKTSLKLSCLGVSDNWNLEYVTRQEKPDKVKCDMYLFLFCLHQSGGGGLVQLPMKSVPITTDVVSSNLDQGEVYNIM